MNTSNKLPLKILVVGCTPLARKVANLAEELAELVGVVNLHPELGASKSNYDIMADFLSRRPHDLYWTRDINDKETINWIKTRAPDLIIQCGWSQIFHSTVLALPKFFCIGIHPAPLLRGRGAAVINWRIIEGGGDWGNSLFIMEEKTDTGDVLDFEQFVIENRDDVLTAYLKVDRTSLRMLRRTLPKIANNNFTRLKQDNSRATRYQRRKPEDGKMDVSWNASQLLNYVRALTVPFPGAFLGTITGKMIVWRAKAGPVNQQAIPGIILNIRKGEGILIQVGNKETVWVTLVTPPNDVECWSDEWAEEIGLKKGQFLAQM